MKLQDVKYGDGDFIFEIPSEQEVKFRVLSTDFECIAKHYDKEKRKYFACIGKEKGCPLCDDANPPVKRFVGYIHDGSQVKLAALPYTILQELKKIYDTNPALFVNDVPQFAISVFRSGSGNSTSYTVTMDVSDDTNFDLSTYQDVKEYIAEQKELTKKEYGVGEVLENKTLENTPPF
jgi:hypothetical protein